jgi:uroporphyrinogen decarboxylase
VLNTRFLKALALEPVDRTPVWMMRQAGRYLPEYRALRKKAGHFLRLCQTPELACQVTLQPLERYDLDAAIIFSDILTIPDAMGLELDFIEAKGPLFKQALETIKEVEALTARFTIEEARLSCLASLDYVYQAVSLVKTELQAKLPLIGFCGSPWTVLHYMLKGSAKEWMLKEPKSMHALLDCLSNMSIGYLKNQIQAGADALMVFDTWGGVCSWADYPSYSLQYMAKIVDALASTKVPVILFSKGSSFMIPQLSATGCSGISVDWTCSLRHARALCTHKGEQRQAIQGNLDPAVLLGSDAVIDREVQRVIQDYGYGVGHIFNLGHGITPNIQPEKVSVFIDSVQRWGKQE